MTTCAIVLRLSFLLLTASFCLPESEEETTPEESKIDDGKIDDGKIDDDADPSEDNHIIIIIILSVAVCILSVALIVTCTIIFLQRNRSTSHPGEVVEAEADLQNNRAQLAQILGDDNIAFDPGDIEEDSDKGTLPQQGSDDISVEVEESGLKYNRRRVPTPPHHEFSDIVTNDEPDLQYSLPEERTQAEVEDRIDSEQRVSIAKDTDQKVYQNIGKDGMLIPIDESEPGEESSEAGTGSDFPGVETGSGVKVRETGIGIESEISSGVEVRETEVEVRETRVVKGPAIGEAEGGAEAEEVGAKKYNPYDNVIFEKNGGVPSICSSNDDGGDYMDMSTVNRTKAEPPRSVSPPIPESPPFNNSLPHFNLEEDRPQSGKSSSANSSN